VCWQERGGSRHLSGRIARAAGIAFSAIENLLYKSNQIGYFSVYLCMNIYNRSSITTFYKEHPDCKATLEKWYHDVEAKNWKRPGEITRDFNTARTIKNSRAIFEINHNDYRLIAEINYLKGWVFIKFIGTHAEYDKVDAELVNLFKNQKRKL
jgi:mRNA interferase HigB